MQTNVDRSAGGHELLRQFLEQRTSGLERHELAAPAPSDDQFEFVMSDESLDRMGDVVKQNWVLKYFKEHPIALFNHDRDQVIGKWANVRVEGKRLLGRLELAAEGTSALVDTIRKLVAQKILRAVSVGFRPLEKEKLNAEASEFWGPFRFLKNELLECSLVAVPANPNALSTAKSLNLSSDAIAQIFRKPAHEDPRRALTGKPAKSLVPIGAKMQISRSQRIEAAEASLVQMTDRLESLDGLETRDENQEAEYLALPQQIEQTTASIAAMQAAEKALGLKTGTRLPATNRIQAPAVIPRRIPDSNQREFVYKTLTALFVSKANNQLLEQVVRERYGHDEIAGSVIRAAVAPANTTVAGWAAELVGVAIADFLNQLPRSAIYPVLQRLGSSFTFGRDGQIKVPSRAATPKINGSFVGEGQPIPVRKAGLTSITLTPKKMAVISTMTKEMSEHSTPSIESVIRQAMNEDTAEAIDIALIDNVAADAIRPAGLLNGLTTLTPAASGTQFEKMVADINTLAAPITAARGGQSLTMLMNPAQKRKMSWAVAPNGTFVFSTVENGVVRDLTVVASTTVPAARVIMLDANEFATATGDTPQYDVSDVATIHEEDTTPLPISATGTPNTVAAPVRSLWQTASIGVRMILPMNWTMRRASMVTFMDGVTW